MTTHHHEQTAARAWRDQAECRDVDPELFFPASQRGPTHDAQVAAAKEVCARCPVRAECLAEALARIPYGIAGGLTGHERALLRRAPGRAAGPAPALRAEADEALTDGPRQGLTTRQRTRIGHDLLHAGRPNHQIAAACGVSTRTVERWATSTNTAALDTSTTSTAGTREGSHGGHRAPLRTFHPQNPQAGTRAAEGDRA